ncbi:hypothetical protein C806_01746 [Lachnospiraceae bacterium 3-1]|nr:hypothetical protein C806_01746 [Lachnospiraceae bacterium 3-1]
MEFLLNERSLHGQFQSGDAFLESLRPVIKCMEILQDCDEIAICKIQNFHECKITENDRLCDLKINGVSDELLRFKLFLDREVYEDPHWDQNPNHDMSQKFIWEGEDVTATSLAEAAITENPLLSFASDRFSDCRLEIKNNKKTYYVDSVHTPRYLLEKYGNAINIERRHILLVRYEGTRIDCSRMEDAYGASILEKKEFEELLSTLDKFVNHESWESIGLDDGLEYKKYSPSSKDNWFRGVKYRGKTIMKFRFSRVLRCYGYRKGDKFKVLRLERDHTISNHG